jgi:23S rRNA pseudouridine2605 synthase
MSERLHKVLAQHGLGSRREVERWIVEGRITLNGRVAHVGDAWNEGDRVQLDGRDVSKRIDRKVAMQVLAYHKPQGQPIEHDERAATRDTDAANEFPADKATDSVMMRLPAQRGSRWVPINPMHAGDSGLLLLTNDGALSYALTRQKKWIPTSYLVRVHVRGGLAHAPELPTTLKLDDGIVEFTKVAVVGDPLETDTEGGNVAGNVWYQVDMARADKRAAVRALFVSHNLTISRMTQVAFGPILLTRDMPRARHVTLTPQQLEQLYALAKLPVPKQPGVLTGKFSGKPAPHAKRVNAGSEAGVGDVARPRSRGKVAKRSSHKSVRSELVEARTSRHKPAAVRGAKKSSNRAAFKSSRSSSRSSPR